MTVELRGDTLLGATCGRTPCDLSGAKPLVKDPSLAKLPAAGIRYVIVPIGKGRRALVVRQRDKARDRTWQAIVVAVPGAAVPRVVFSGWTGLTSGVAGERTGKMVAISESKQGGRSIVVGEQHENMSLCGRPAVMSPKVLVNSTLTLKPAKVQRLTAAERRSALKLRAVRVQAEETAAGDHQLLRALAASSAIGNPQHLTDSDPDTTWSEGRGGTGRGEFALLRAAPEIPISSFEFVFRPRKNEIKGGAAPKEFWLAGRQKLFHVTVPEDGWAEAGARYRVKLPTAMQSDCYAVVHESSYAAGKNVRVTFAEITAQSEFGAADPDALIQALAGGGPRADAAGAVLRTLGDEALRKLAARYVTLDERAQSVALDVLDHGQCNVALPAYVEALRAAAEGQRIHAQQRIRRCGKEAGRALAKAVRTARRHKDRLLWGAELALLDPARTVAEFVRLTRNASKRQRRAYRLILGRAGVNPSAKQAVAKALAQGGHAGSQIELLRSLGPGVTKHQAVAASALQRLLSGKPTFRTRYLLLEPAAHLAAKSGFARHFVAAAMTTDRNPHQRAHAASVATNVRLFKTELGQALRDPYMRVREAAVQSAATPQAHFAQAALLHRLARDKWPTVRAQSAAALALHRRSADVDKALAAALADPSHHVRRPAALALGLRGARRYDHVLIDHLNDAKEHVDVRAGAAEALGRMCAKRATGDLTTLALALAKPMVTQEDRTLGSYAVQALGRLRPADLRKRLAPLFGKEASRLARSAAQAALREKGTCR